MQRLKVTRSLLAAAVVVTLASSNTVFARNGGEEAHAMSSPTTTPVQTSEGGATATPVASPKLQVKHENEASKEASTPDANTDHQQNKQSRLDNRHEAMCEKKQSVMNARMREIDDRAVKQLVLFDAVAARTQAFTSKHHFSVTHYETLLANVAAARAKAQAALSVAKAEATISCTSADPKGQVEAYKTAMKAAAVSLKNYREAVKALLLAVKAVAPHPSSSPVASVTPEAAK